MTLSSAVNRWDYVGNGAVSVYAYTKKIFSQTHLVVTVADADGVETTLTITTDYTVSGVGETAGGNVTLVNSGQAWLTAGKLTSGYDLVIRRVVPLTQETDLRNQGDFFPENYEDALDTLMMVCQQLQEQINRAVLVSITGEVIDQDDLNESLADAIAAAAAAASSASSASTSASAASSSAAAAAASASAASASAVAAAASAAEAAASAASVSVSCKIVNFTRDTSLATGSQAVTGVGFTPKAVILLAVQNSSLEWSIGFDNGVESMALLSKVDTSNFTLATTKSIHAYESGTNEYTGEISSMDADGFTISWIKSNTPTGTLAISAMCLR